MDFRKIIYKLGIIACYLILLIGLAVAGLVYFLNWTAPGLAATIAFCSVSYGAAFFYIVPTFIILRFHFSGKKKIYKLIVIGICGLLVVTSLMPTFGAYTTISRAERQFKDEYGANYNKYLLEDHPDMMKEAYSLYDNLNVIPDDSKIEIDDNIKYYENEDDKFYFDYYGPKHPDKDLPVIIKLHGGAWVLGNKGPVFNVPLSKYLAAHGYVVLDVEYGLADFNKAADKSGFGSLGDMLETAVSINPKLKENVLPDYKKNYKIQDQVEIIGEFTKFLAEHADDYHADIDNVFLMGSSAGAHMASVIGAGYNSTKFNNTFSQDLTIRGIILFYPPTDLIKMRDAMEDGSLGAMPGVAKGFTYCIDPNGKMSDKELTRELKKYSAAYLIQDDDVEIAPILILHGEYDNLVPYKAQAVDFYHIAKDHHRKCILLSFPYSGHAFDVPNSQSYGWQVSTYYTERFLALEVN